MATSPSVKPAKALISWPERIDPNQLADERFKTALRTLDDALVATISYLADRKRGAAESLEKQTALTSKWMAASEAIAPLDHDFSHALMMKGMGWTDPTHWATADRDRTGISIEDMQKARRILNARRNEVAGHSVPKWFPVAGVGFAAITLAFLMYLLVSPPIDQNKEPIFHAFLAFSVAASGAFLGGTAAAQGKLPLGNYSPVQFSAAGGVGIFIVVFLLLKVT